MFHLPSLFVQKAFATSHFGAVPDTGGYADIRGGVVALLNFALTFLALIAAVVIVIAGIRLIFGQGDDESKESAKKTILFAIIGLLVVLFAKAIVTLIVGPGLGY